MDTLQRHSDGHGVKQPDEETLKVKGAVTRRGAGNMRGHIFHLRSKHEARDPPLLAHSKSAAHSRIHPQLSIMAKKGRKKNRKKKREKTCVRKRRHKKKPARRTGGIKNTRAESRGLVGGSLEEGRGQIVAVAERRGGLTTPKAWGGGGSSSHPIRTCIPAF